MGVRYRSSQQLVVHCLVLYIRMTYRSLIFLALVAAGQAAIAPAAEYEDAQAGIRFTEEDKVRLVKELEDEELSKEIENLVSNLDDEQLEQLEEILAKDLDEASEFDMLMAELKEMGMDEEDIKDLLELSGMMTKFLNKVLAIMFQRILQIRVIMIQQFTRL